MAAVKVEQSDREAAAAYLEAKRGYAMGGIIRRGENDDGSTVQAFARHRQAERERCAMIAADRAPAVQCMSVEPIVSACLEIATAIREPSDAE